MDIFALLLILIIFVYFMLPFTLVFAFRILLGTVEPLLSETLLTETLD